LTIATVAGRTKAPKGETIKHLKAPLVADMKKVATAQPKAQLLHWQSTGGQFFRAIGERRIVLVNIGVCQMTRWYR
jgi:hypothetical protein